MRLIMRCCCNRRRSAPIGQKEHSMKTPFAFFFSCFACLCAACPAIAQGTFVNLDFEAAVVPTVPPGQPVYPISLTDALPGWTCYYITNQAAYGSYNGVSLGAVNIGLVDGHTSDYS